MYQKLYHFVITLPKVASNHHTAHKSFSVREQQVQWGTFPSWLTHQLCQEVICHTLQEPPRMFPLCCIVFPADIRAQKRIQEATRPLVFNPWESNGMSSPRNYYKPNEASDWEKPAQIYQRQIMTD
ncbi:hypothetical protein QYF61_023106 [Mycteria americana]|uniref:Uncharacterized protein n=1 Tax=Mycteria americana TaxID=33587 RepID=A0AAN7SA56_MYCAM|nr:hypothetical protein QYF61_023106 [Mycteria americana]